jgi:hypothetical protein
LKRNSGECLNKRIGLTYDKKSLRAFVVESESCLQTTADKREIKDHQIALRATSYTRNMLSEIKLNQSE